MSEELVPNRQSFYMFSVKTNKATHVGSTGIIVVPDDPELDTVIEYAKREAAHIVNYNKETFVSLVITDEGEVIKEFDSLEDENGET